MKLDEIRKACEEASPAPWEWHVADYSMADLIPDGEAFSPVLSVAPCGSCQEKAKEEGVWKWGRCLTPSKHDADFIAAARTALPLLVEVAEAAKKVSWVFVCHCDPAYKKIGRHDPGSICGEDEELRAALRALEES